MSYRKSFKADTAEKAKALAQDFKASLDHMRQPSVSGPFEMRDPNTGQVFFMAYVHYYGLD